MIQVLTATGKHLALEKAVADGSAAAEGQWLCHYCDNNEQ